ncbi:Metallo-dependent hydrolase [Coniophora puteana RWD-64-598 SS2]|uniref:Metallo-dependent hydrolase n=1 Tax=Coniophora puteana (strain RWD-64-598) TaxID=741705 RepID=A0A5M3N428_CONPW|nr:Metallo-dependent hydrolase [Coniophora puteana RWD-64-598 SS2]EIW86058.1 Metallo-dependent hydrolase [Coniophora puteana RWD-64-598 SS2]
MSTRIVEGPAKAALNILAEDDITFLHSLPKAELHAHLNGSIPLPTLRILLEQYQPDDLPNSLSKDVIEAQIRKFEEGVGLNKISDFFSLFPAVYALTSSPEASSIATRAVLDDFLEPGLDGHPQATYIELRTTPREIPGKMSRREYLEAVLKEVEARGRESAGLIVSLDRRMTSEVMHECVGLAIQLKSEGRPIVGIDLCGDPQAGDVENFKPHLTQARQAGLRLTLHIAEIAETSPDEHRALLNLGPSRLGHATFLPPSIREHYFGHVSVSEDAPADVITMSRRVADKPCVEICLTSNLLCKTVPDLQAHHIRAYLKNSHPVSICTDDTLPFRTSLLGEYALLLAKPPHGLGLSREEVVAIARMSMDSRFI